jgi:hypothetical protein
MIMKYVSALIATLSAATALLFLPAAAYATAMYSTTASSTFAIAADGVALGPVFTAKTEIGAGVAFFSGAQSVAGVFPATLSVAIAGSAAQPPNSLATSTYMSGHIFSIDNTHGGGTLIVPFTFSYEWDTDIAVTDVLREFAEAGAFFHITGIDNEGLTIEGMSVTEYLVNPRYSTGLGSIGGFGAFTVHGTIEVPDGVYSEFSVITDATGRAFAVPEPSTLWLLGLGLVAVLQRRKASARLGSQVQTH